METVKYQYAINSTGKTINVDSLIASSEVRREQFKCISCDNLLVPVLGEKNRKHFRHKVDVDIECSPETYLHKLAKLRFHEIYNNCLQEKQPFWIEINFTKYCSFYEEEFLVPCIFSKGKHKFDLTQYFQDIKLEPNDGSFIPDLLLTNKNEKEEKIFVEIAVTHKSTLEKRQSEQRIIEININNEHDIKPINDRLLSENDKINFWNFMREQTRDFCDGICKVNSHKNCYLCLHHSYLVNKGKDIPVYCGFFKRTFDAKEANNCSKYRPVY